MKKNVNMFTLAALVSCFPSVSCKMCKTCLYIFLLWAIQVSYPTIAAGASKPMKTIWW